MRSTVARFALAAALGSACGASAAASLTVRVADQSSASVEDAVAYAVPVGGGAAGRSPPAPAEIAQVKLAFVPPVTVVQAGSSISFPNRDTVRHQVYSFSPTKVFELRLYAGVPAAPIVFDKPGLVVLGCNIHDRMVAYVMVVDTPWFGKTAANGQVRIDGLPPGDYKVSVWHPRMPAEVAPKTVHVASTDATIDAVVDLKPGP